MEKNKCITPGCKQEGGLFHYTAKGMKCHHCWTGAATRDGAKSTFPYVTTHLDGSGKPVTVQSLRHLRQLEKQHGVHSTAHSYDSKNFERG